MLIVLSGIPGSGKSTWAKFWASRSNDIKHISRDACRDKIRGDSTQYFSDEKATFKLFVEEIQAALDDDNDYIVIADATHITKASRKKLLSSLNLEGQVVIGLEPLIPLEVALQRNEFRGGFERVPEDVIRRMHDNYEPLEESEGFHYLGYIGDYNEKELEETPS